MSEIDQLREEFRSEIDFIKEKLDNLVRPAPADVVPDVIPSDHPSLAEGMQPAPGVIAGLAPSPFADADEAKEQADEVPTADEEAPDETLGGGTTNDQLPAQSSEATSVSATDANSVVAPEAEVTPTTENPPTTSA